MTGIDRAVIKKVAERYTRTGTKFYVHGKLGSDPICAQVVLAAGDLGTLVDVGCGRGQMGFLLLELGKAKRVVGYDWDQEKIDEAIAAAGGDEQFHFHVGDTRTEEIQPCDTVLMLDVLHYLTDDEQDALVQRAAKSARHTVIVRELDPDRGWRSSVTSAQESITTFFRYNVGARVRIRPISCIIERLAAAGFTVRVEPSWGSTPFANVAVIASR